MFLGAAPYHSLALVCSSFAVRRRGVDFVIGGRGIDGGPIPAAAPVARSAPTVGGMDPDLSRTEGSNQEVAPKYS